MNVINFIKVTSKTVIYILKLYTEIKNIFRQILIVYKFLNRFVKNFATVEKKKTKKT